MKYLIACLFLFSCLNASEKPIVTCELRGQLGNQLFEIATTVAFALDNGYEPVFPGLLSAWGGAENHRAILHRISVRNLDVSYSRYGESHPHIYHPLYEGDGKENICLCGFFQSEKYFIHHADTIKELFAPTQDVLNYIQRRYGHLLKQAPVALHVRTFLTDGKDPDVVGFGGLYPGDPDGENWDYYLRAMELFPDETPILVFSDCNDWVRSRFPACSKHIIFIEGEPRHIDFYLMSLCSHQIISQQSTFSWWAAWLNKNPDKRVIISNKGWGSVPYFDYIPEGWLRI